MLIGILIGMAMGLVITRPCALQMHSYDTDKTIRSSHHSFSWRCRRCQTVVEYWYARLGS